MRPQTIPNTSGVRILLTLGCLLTVWATAPALAELPIAELDRENPVDFDKEILPILRTNCLACHNQTDAESDLVLESPASMVKGGSDGPSVIPGKSAESLLLQVAAHRVDPIMPPEDNEVGARALTAKELGLLKLWIDGGAKPSAGTASNKIEWQPLPPGINPIYAVSMTDDGRYVAAGRANQIFMYDVARKKSLGRLIDPGLTPHSGETGTAHLDMVQSLAFSPDGNWLGSGGYRIAKLWRRVPVDKDARPSESWGALTHPATVFRQSPDRKWLVVGQENGELQIFDATTRKPITTLQAHTDRVTDVDFSKDGIHLVSCSDDKTIRLWDIKSRQQVGLIQAPTKLRAVAYCGNATIVSAGAENVIRCWKTADGHHRKQLRLAHLQAASISSDQKRLCFVNDDSEVVVFDLVLKKSIRTVSGAGGTRQLVTASDGSVVGQLFVDGRIRISSVDSAKSSAIECKGSEPTCVALRADGKQIAIGTAEGRVIRIDLASEDESAKQEELLARLLQSVVSVAYSPDGNSIYAATVNGYLRRLEASSGNEQFESQQRTTLRDMSISSDGKLLATAGNDHEVRLWNASNGQPAAVHRLGGFAQPVRQVSFSGDSKYVVSAGSRGKIIVHEVESGQVVSVQQRNPRSGVLVVWHPTQQHNVVLTTLGPSTIESPIIPHRRLYGHEGPVSALACVDENQFVSGGTDGTARLWQIDSGQPVRVWQHAAAIRSLAISQQHLATAGKSMTKLWQLADKGDLIAEVKSDYRVEFNREQSRLAAEVAKLHVEYAKGDLDKGNELKKQEDENLKKAQEKLKSSEDDLKKKQEAFEKADTARLAAEGEASSAKDKLAVTADKKTAAEEIRDKAASALAEAKQPLENHKSALSDATEAKATLEQQLAALRESSVDGSHETEIAELTQKIAVAVAHRQDVHKNVEAAQAEFTRLEQELSSAKAAVEAAVAKFDEAQKVNDEAEKKAKEQGEVAKKANDAKTDSTRQVDAAKRSIERAQAAVRRAADALPALKDAHSQQKSKHAERDAAWTSYEALAKASAVNDLQFSADGSLLAVGGPEGTVQTIQVSDGEVLSESVGHSVIGVCFDEMNRLIVAGRDRIDFAPQKYGWRLVRSIGTGQADSSLEDRVTALEFSPDSSQLAIGGGQPSRSGELKLFDVETGDLVRDFTDAHSDTVFDIAFSPDATRLASCGADRFMKVFRSDDGSLVKTFEGHTHHVLGCSWHPAGRFLASSGADKVVKLWNIKSGEQVKTIQGFGKEVTAIEFAGVGKQMAATCGDKQLYQCDTDGGRNSINTSGDFLYSVSASANGQLIAFGGHDSVVKVVKPDGTEIVQFAPPE